MRHCTYIHCCIRINTLNKLSAVLTRTVCIFLASAKKKKKTKKVSESEVGVSKKFVAEIQHLYLFCVTGVKRALFFFFCLTGDPAERRLLHPARVHSCLSGHFTVAPLIKGQTTGLTFRGLVLFKRLLNPACG